MATDPGFGRNSGSRVMVANDDEAPAPVADDDGLLGDVDWARAALVEGPDGRAPHSAGWWAKRLAVPVVLAIAAIVAYSVLRVQTNLEVAAARILEAEGIDTSSLEFDATFRDVEVTGTLPKGVDAATIRSLLEAREGPNGEDIRSATVLATAVLGSIDVVAASDGVTLTLTGSVPDAAHEETLLGAAGESGANVVDQLEVEDRDFAAEDPEGQIRSLAVLLPFLGDSITSGTLTLDDTTLTGALEAVDPATSDRIAELAGPGVTVTSLGNVDTMVTFDGTRVVLDGEVLSTEQATMLSDAAADAVGPTNLVNNLSVSGLGEAVPGSDDRIAGLAALLRNINGFNSADVSMSDTRLTVNGEAFDPDARIPIDAAIADLAETGLRTGGAITLGFELTLQEEIDLLQAELDALQDEIRENVRFDTDSDGLTDVAGATLDHVVEAMNRYTRPVVEVGGHTDSRGNDDHNRTLSQERADAVVAYLAERGIAGERLNSVGHGESQPVADNETDEGQQQNRRVSFTARESF